MNKICTRCKKDYVYDEHKEFCKKCEIYMNDMKAFIGR